MPQFALRPGRVRPEDTDGEDDPPIEPVPQFQILVNENGVPIVDEIDQQIAVSDE